MNAALVAVLILMLVFFAPALATGGTTFVEKQGKNPLQYRNLVPEAGDMTAEEARRIATRTATDAYMLPEGYLDAFAVHASLFNYISIQGSEDYKSLEVFDPIWEIAFFMEDGSRLAQTLASSDTPSFTVWISAADNSALWISYLDAGDVSTQGAAAEPEGEVIAFLDLLRFEYDWADAQAKAERKKGMPLAEWTVEERAAFYEEHIIEEAQKCGVAFEGVVHVYPPEGAITEREAVQTAREALTAAYGVSGERLAGMAEGVQCLSPFPGDKPYWRIDYYAYGGKAFDEYIVILDISTGDVLETEYVNQGNSNG